MKRATLIISGLSVLALAGFTTFAIADDDSFGWCPRGGYGNGQGGGYGYHMRGNHGGGFGMMFGGPAQMQRFVQDGNYDLQLTPERVKEMLEGKLAWRGNPNVQVGEVTTDKDGNILAQMVTKDNSLIETIKIDPKTGAHSPLR